MFPMLHLNAQHYVCIWVFVWASALKYHHRCVRIFGHVYRATFFINIHLNFTLILLENRMSKPYGAKYDFRKTPKLLI